MDVGSKDDGAEELSKPMDNGDSMDRRKTGFASGCLLCPIPFLIHTSFILSVAVHDLTGRIFRVRKGGNA